MKNYDERISELFHVFIQCMTPSAQDALTKYEDENWEESTPVRSQPVTYERHRENFNKYNADQIKISLFTRMLWWLYLAILVFIMIIFADRHIKYDEALQVFVLHATGPDMAIPFFAMIVVSVVMLAIIWFMGRLAHKRWLHFYSRKPIHIYGVWYVKDYNGGTRTPCINYRVKS